MGHEIDGSVLVTRREGKSRFRRQILEDWDRTCYLCGARPEHLTLDHLVPRRRGGETSRRNLAPACAPCNRRKGCADLWEHWCGSPSWNLERAVRLISWLRATAAEG